MGTLRRRTLTCPAALFCALAAAQPAPAHALDAQNAPSSPPPPSFAVAIDPPVASPDVLAAIRPAANEPPEFTALKARLLRGDRPGGAIKELQRLSGRNASCADIPYLLGQLYLEKLWVGDGLKAFRRALEIDPTLRANPFLIRAVLVGLANDRDHHQVQRFLIQDIGSPAAPYVEEVLYGEWRQQVKERAAAVLREIS